MFNMMGGCAPSLADIAAVTGNNGNSNNGCGDGNGWWVLIILFALFGGWGRGGYGDNGGNGGGSSCYCGAATADIQRGFDNQGVTNKLNGLENGLCSLGYDILSQNNGLAQTVTQTGWGIQQAIQADTVANMQNNNALSRQLADCCCENRQAVAQVRYDMATDNCATITAIDKLGDRLENRLTQMEMSRKDETIADLRSQVNSLNLAVSQRNQTEVFNQRIDRLQDTLRPCPTPAYITCNPWAAQAPYGSCCCNNNNGCCN